MKLIHIVHHSYPFYQPEEPVNFIKDDWSVSVAEQILKETNTYEIECWRPERKTKRIIKGNSANISYKIFPSVYLANGMEYSLTLQKELSILSKKEEILVHLHGIFNLLSLSIANQFKNIPILGQDHGASSYHEAHSISRHPLKFLYKPMSIIEKNALRNIDHFFVLTNHQKEILSKLVKRNNVDISTMGVDYNKFRPLNKIISRELLHLPIDKKILLYVGRFDDSKGFDLILNAFKKLRTNYQVELVAVGGMKSDPLYNEARSVGAHVIERIPAENLMPYYSSADVYCCFIKRNLWGGIGIAPIESLACGTPVVSNTLEHFPERDRKYIGENPNNADDLMISLVDVLENNKTYNNCRNISKKNYNWQNIIKHTLTTYEELSSKYY